MTEEGYFKKYYPDYCYGNRLLSPYWDLFQDGVEFGERQSETKIAELEQENNKLLDVINNQDVKIADLEKENEELRNNGFTVSAMTEQQLKVALEKGEQLEKENAELKRNKKTVVHLADCLEEKMKERIEELETRCNELFLQNNEFAEQFEKSKEIIKGLLSCCRNYPQENAEKMKQAKQFLKEIEK